MDHIVFLDYKSKEMENLLSNSKDTIIRGATGRKLPYGRCDEEDILYFVNNNGEQLIKAKAKIISVEFSKKLTKDESEKLFDLSNRRALLCGKAILRFKGKRYLSIIEVGEIEPLEAFRFDRSNYGNMDDWLPVGNINKVRL